MKSAFLTLRSALFTPATRLASLEKAMGSGADLVILDLEDAVAIADKPGARVALSALPPRTRAQVALRINAAATEAGLRDLLFLRECPGWKAVMLPKTETTGEVALTQAHLQGAETPVIALIETASGLEAAPGIAAHPAVAALALGGADLAADLGVTMAWAPLLAARARLVQAGAMGRCAAWDVPSLVLDDDAAVEAEAKAVRELGMKGKLAIHPRQIAALHRAFSPDEAEIRQARRILDTLAAAGGGACSLDGRMIDRPLALAAQNLLKRAGEAVEGNAP